MAFTNSVDLIGDAKLADQILFDTVTEFNDNVITTVGNYAFHRCASLHSVNLPNVVTLSKYAFQYCTSLTNVSLPNVSTIEQGPYNASNSAFGFCSALETICLPMASNLAVRTFESCSRLMMADFHSLERIEQYAFAKCSALINLILRNNSVCIFNMANGLSDTQIGKGAGHIYVPRALIEDYKVATNWSTYADQFRALEDYTVDGTTTGKFAAGVIHYNLQCMYSSNTETFVEGSYRTTLTVLGNNPFVSVTMDGIDITTDVYNSETHEIVIPQVAGYVVITATAELDADAGTIYRLPAPTAFNGTSDYIDTGIKLFDTPKDFTIVCSADFSALGSNICLLHCMNEASPYPGLSVDGNSGVRISFTGTSSLNTSITNKNNVSALAFRFKAGVLDAIRYKDVSGNIVTVAHSTAATYTAITQNLLIGAYQTTDGTKGRYYKGIIKSFRVFGVSLTDDLITSVLQTA